MYRQLLLVALSSLVLLRPSPAAAQYTVDLVDVPGSTATSPFSINDRGQIVGSFVDSGGTSHGFLRSNGQFTTIDAPAATYTVAHGINNTGQIVGTYRDNVGRFHGFLLAGSQFTTIDPPNSNQTELVGINDLGQIIGRFTPSGGQVTHFLCTHGQFVTLTSSAAPYLELYGINSRGQIVGALTGIPGGFPLDDRGFRLEARGDISTLVFPGSGFTTPTGINMLGEVVGYTDGVPRDLKLRGFLLAYGTYTLIEVPGSVGTQAFANNNRHQIVGGYTDRSGGTNRQRGFLFTPPDESADVSGSASADRSRVPQAPVIFDSDLTLWTLGPGQEILHSGSQAAGGYGSQILWYQGSIYVLGDDSNWWRWTGSAWAFAGPNDPSL